MFRIPYDRRVLDINPASRLVILDEKVTSLCSLITLCYIVFINVYNSYVINVQL